MKKLILIFGIIFVLIINTNATTWFPAKHKCPICNKKSTYQNIGSWGSYIYHWDSKYQYIYWPMTESPSIYCCPKCQFSSYLWDFDSIPKNKIDTLKQYLKTIKLNKKYKDYMQIPITTRLEIAENVYRILGKDDNFWCEFYRILGYHYEETQNHSKAYENRCKAIKIANTMLLNEHYQGQEKELFYILATMNYKINQIDTALLYLNKAIPLIYNNKQWEEKNSNNLNAYLSELIIDFKKTSCIKDFENYRKVLKNKKSNEELADEFEIIYKRYSKEPFFESILFNYLKSDSSLFSYHDIGIFLIIKFEYTDIDNYDLAEKVFLKGIEYSKNLKDTDIPMECMLLFDLTYLNYSNGYFEKATANVKQMQKVTNPDGIKDCLEMGYALEKEESDRFYSFINKSKD